MGCDALLWNRHVPKMPWADAPPHPPYKGEPQSGLRLQVFTVTVCIWGNRGYKFPDADIPPKYSFSGEIAYKVCKNLWGNAFAAAAYSPMGFRCIPPACKDIPPELPGGAWATPGGP